MGQISQGGDGTSPAPATDHAQLHGGEILGLVHNDVPVGLFHARDEGLSFVEQGQVGTGPSLVAGPLGRRPGQALSFFGREQPLGSSEQKSLVGEEPAEDTRCRDGRPRFVQDALEGAAGPDVVFENSLTGDVGGGLGDMGRPRQFHQLLAQELAPVVVTYGTLQDRTYNLGHGGSRELHRAEAGADLKGVGRCVNVIEHRPAHDLGHAPVALKAGGAAGFRTVDLVAGAGQTFDRQLGGGGLPEGRQYLGYVPQEDPVWPHYEQPLPLEKGPVFVQQVRGTVQPDGGLAGTGPTLDDDATLHAGRG